ncbi:MAG: trypsin-like serine protease [Frankiaceae bacterium]
MKSRARALAAAVLAAGTITATIATPAVAITGGHDDGNAHPNVAMIAFYDSTGRFRCSATLVSPTVLLTAAHCTDGTLGKTAVTFDSFIADAPPSPLPAAADPSAGYTAAELAAAGYLSGTAYTHPNYSNFTDLRNWNDTGVIVLDRPYTAAAPQPLAPLGYLDRLSQPELTKTLFTFVGYGTEVRKADSGPQKPTPMSYPLRRQWVESQGQKLGVQVFQTNGNANDPFGGGGTCFGDSGGPALLDGYLVGDTSYGYTSNCRYLDGYQRVDIKSVQDWLATFGVTPAA